MLSLEITLIRMRMEGRTTGFEDTVIRYGDLLHRHKHDFDGIGLRALVQSQTRSLFGSERVSFPPLESKKGSIGAIQLRL